MRCYNGCPDDELAALLKARSDAKAKARKMGYGIAYYPIEGKYAAYRLEDYASVGPFCHEPQDCLPHIEAFEQSQVVNVGR